MAQKDYPKTNAIRCLLEHGIEFESFTYKYEERGGTRRRRADTDGCVIAVQSVS